MPISDNIRLLREHFNITQKELATIAGVSESAVSLWELEKTQPRMGAIQKMADHFGIKKSNLIEESGMAEILHRPYNLNDMEHFSMLPSERLNNKQVEALLQGEEFAGDIASAMHFFYLGMKMAKTFSKSDISEDALLAQLKGSFSDDTSAVLAELLPKFFKLDEDGRKYVMKSLELSSTTQSEGGGDK